MTNAAIQVTANAAAVATLKKKANAVVASAVEKQLNASVMNTNAATVAPLSLKLADVVTTRRSKPQRRVDAATTRRRFVAMARRLKLQRRVNAVTARRLSNQTPQKSLSQSVARRSQSKSKIL